MLFAGWEGRIVKNCDQGHSFSLYGPALSRQKLFIVSLRKIGLQVGLSNFVIELAGFTCRPLTIVKI